MTVNAQTVATFMASFFGKSEKVISEKLTTDEHNQFTTEATELQEKVTGLQAQVTNLENAKTTLEGEKTTLEARIETLTGEKTTLESDKTTLQNSLTSTETDRDKYKAWFEKQAGVGAQLPEGDATNNGKPEMASYNQQALEVFRKSKNQ